MNEPVAEVGLLALLVDLPPRLVELDLEREGAGAVETAPRLNRDLFMNNDKNGDRMNKSYS